MCSRIVAIEAAWKILGSSSLVMRRVLDGGAGEDRGGREVRSRDRGDRDLFWDIEGEEPADCGGELLWRFEVWIGEGFWWSTSIMVASMVYTVDSKVLRVVWGMWKMKRRATERTSLVYTAKAKYSSPKWGAVLEIDSGLFEIEEPRRRQLMWPSTGLWVYVMHNRSGLTFLRKQIRRDSGESGGCVADDMSLFFFNVLSPCRKMAVNHLASSVATSLILSLYLRVSSFPQLSSFAFLEVLALNGCCLGVAHSCCEFSQ